jgi:signal transduction histidine kinase
MPYSAEKKIALGVCTAFVALILLSAGAWWTSNRLGETFRWVDHTHQVLYELETLRIEVLSIRTESSRYLITGDEGALVSWSGDIGRAQAVLARLDELTRDNPPQHERIAQFTPLLEHVALLTRQRHELRQREGPAAAFEDAKKGEVRRVAHEVILIVQAAEKVERDLLLERTLRAQAAGKMTFLAVLGSSIVAAVLIGITVSLGFRELGRRRLAEDEIRRLNHELKQRAGQLEVTNRELEAFSYSVSHDLRAPLRHIDGFAGLLQKKSDAALDEQGRRYLTVISNAAKQMGRLIDDLLSFSRMGRAEMHLIQADSSALVADVIREGGFDRTAPRIEWHIAPLPALRADGTMLRQVWFNLISNAVKYSAKVPQPRIEIGVREDAPATEHVFYVRDNGAGFDMQYVDKLFGVFQRLHSDSEFEGTGIGLANVRRIVTRHGGRTWAEGCVGSGSVFFFSIPVSPGPARPASE